MFKNKFSYLTGGTCLILLLIAIFSNGNEANRNQLAAVVGPYEFENPPYGKSGFYVTPMQKLRSLFFSTRTSTPYQVPTYVERPAQILPPVDQPFFATMEPPGSECDPIRIASSLCPLYDVLIEPYKEQCAILEAKRARLLSPGTTSINKSERLEIINDNLSTCLKRFQELVNKQRECYEGTALAFKDCEEKFGVRYR